MFSGGGGRGWRLGVEREAGVDGGSVVGVERVADVEGGESDE